MYALWLGEAHTPLARFAARLTELRASAHDDVLRMVRTPAQLRDKFRTDVPALVQRADEAPRSMEHRAVHAALAYGPLAGVGAVREAALRALLAAAHTREYVGD